MLSLSLEKELLSVIWFFLWSRRPHFLAGFHNYPSRRLFHLNWKWVFSPPLPSEVAYRVGVDSGIWQAELLVWEIFFCLCFFVVWFWVLQMEELLDSCQHKDVFRWKKQWWLANHEPWMPINDSLPLLMASGGCFPWWLILLWKSLLPFLCCQAFLDRQSSDAHFSCNKFCSSFAPKGPGI